MAGKYKVVPAHQRVERKRGRAGQRQRQRRLDRSGGLCEHCLAAGRTTIATVVNHILPLAHGGSDFDENTENLCEECDRRVTAEQFGYRSPDEFGVDKAGRPTGVSHPWNTNSR